MGSYEQISAFTEIFFVLSIEIFVNLLDEVKEDLKVVKSSEDQNGIVELELLLYLNTSIVLKQEEIMKVDILSLLKYLCIGDQDPKHSQVSVS